MSETVPPASDVETLEALFRDRLLPLTAWDPVRQRVTSARAQPPDGRELPAVLQPAAVLVPVVEREGGVSVILTRRADGLRRHSGQIAFPGGRADPGEPPGETALRETREEIGLDRGFVRITGLSDTFDTATGYSITPVVGLVRPGFALTLEAQEVAEVFETPFAFLMDPANHELRARDFGDGRQRRFFAIPHEGRLIWGVTAGILRMLYERLYGQG